MIRSLARLARRTRRAARSENGNASVEFVFLFPLFLTLLISAIESGLMTMRYVWLDRAVDITVRDLRLGILPIDNEEAQDNHDAVKNAICARGDLLLPDCEDTLHLELIQVDTTLWNVPDPDAECVDRAGVVNPALRFEGRTQNGMMIIRACYIVDPLVPDIGLGARFQRDRDTGDVALIVSSAFVNEPD